MFEEILVDMYKPVCENPILLVNRAALNYAKLGGVVHGDMQYIVRSYDVKNIPIAPLIKYAKNNPDDVDKCFVEMPSGYREPLFIYAPCNKCTLCRESKRNDLVFRSIMETACYNCPPVFFTLTYDNAHLPALNVGDKKIVHGNLQYKDVQDFFKRLRRKWDRQGLKHNIRYLVSGEYGSNYGRAHYHVLMWNNPYGADENNPLMFKKLENDIFNAWGKCQRVGFDFGQCRGGASAYAAKYVSKPCKMHGHTVKPFIHCSCGHGGLGAPLLKQVRKYLRNNPSLRQVSFRGYDGNLFEVGFSSYIVSHVWPSPTRLVPAKLKSLYKQYCDTLACAQALGIMTYDECHELADLVNPCPVVLPNQYKSIPRRFHCDHAIDYYYKPLIFGLLHDINTELCELYEIDADYLNQYFVYKGLQPSSLIRHNASKILRIKDKLSQITDKEIF